MSVGNRGKRIKRRSRKLKWIISIEAVLLVALIGTYFLCQNQKRNGDSEPVSNKHNTKIQQLTKEQVEAEKEQELLKKQKQEREDLIAKADRLILSYDYDGAIQLIKSYQGPDGDYEVYPVLQSAVANYEEQKKLLVLYGGSYTSITQINHIFFHSLIADNSRAFDGDRMSQGYNMYMTTISEFNKIMQKMYQDGYVLVGMHDIMKKETEKDGSAKFVPEKIYLPKGKKPFVLSQDDVNYYKYMEKDGFASRIILGKDGKPTCEMVKKDGSVITGAFDMVPIIDAFVEEHPDFSYRGAKGMIALTGYEGILGYRTNDPKSPTYDQDKKAVKELVRAMKAEGWEFASHSWGHKNHRDLSVKLLKKDAKRWANEVEPLIGPTDIYVFPFGVEIQDTIYNYNNKKYKLLKSFGFDIFCGVYKGPWMQIRKDYVRMMRRPLDGQAMLQFPDRLKDLFQVKEIVDPERPKRNW